MWPRTREKTQTRFEAARTETAMKVTFALGALHCSTTSTRSDHVVSTNTHACPKLFEVPQPKQLSAPVVVITQVLHTRMPTCACADLLAATTRDSRNWGERQRKRHGALPEIVGGCAAYAGERSARANKFTRRPTRAY